MILTGWELDSALGFITGRLCSLALPQKVNASVAQMHL